MPKKKHWNPEAESGDGTAPEVHSQEGAGVPRDPPDPIAAAPKARCPYCGGEHSLIDCQSAKDALEYNPQPKTTCPAEMEHDEPAPSIKEFLGEEREGRLAAARRYLANLPHLRTIRDDREIIDKLAEHLHEALTLLPARWHLEHAENDRKAAEAKQQPLPVSMEDLQPKTE